MTEDETTVYINQENIGNMVMSPNLKDADYTVFILLMGWLGFARVDGLTAPIVLIGLVYGVSRPFAASAVLSEVWGGDRTGMPPNLLRALAHSGNYAVGLYDGERMVGASVAFFAAPAQRSMHSHITGVLAGYRSLGLGRLLKQHQRDWAFAHGVGHITWTFDPLVARNAHFNLDVLGAVADGRLEVHVGGRYSWEDAAQAYADQPVARAGRQRHGGNGPHCLRRLCHSPHRAAGGWPQRGHDDLALRALGRLRRACR